MRRNCKHILTVLMLLCLSVGAQAQYDLTTTDHLILKYPNSSQAFQKIRKTYRISLVNDQLKASLTNEQDRLILKTGTFALNAEELESDTSFLTLTDYAAYSLAPENNKYVKKEVKKFYKNDEFKRSLFTHDSRTTQFFFPSNNARSITHLEYSMDVKDPHFTPKVYTQAYIPIEQFELVVTVDHGIDLKFLYFNTDSTQFKRSVVKGKKYDIYTWTAKEVKESKYFGDAPDACWYLPHIVIRIMGYQTSKGYQPYLSSVNDLFSYYNRWINKIKQEDTELIERTANEIVGDHSSDYEKLEAIFKWVQTNIKYIAHATGEEGFVPRSATSVLNSRFGDCKGMTNLMYNLSHAVGVNTQRCWIGTRDLCYTYEELPSPLVDNHMILAYLNGDSTIFLDATDEELSFGSPSEFTQGKQALIALGDTNFTLRTVPQVVANENVITDSVRVKIVGSDLIGSGQAVFKGYHASNWKHRFKHQSPEEVKEFMTGYLLKGDNRFQILDFKQLNEDQTVAINYNFRIPNYVNTHGGKSYINMNLESSFGISSIEDDREIPVELRYAMSGDYTVVLEIPSDQKVEHVPSSNSVEKEKYGYQVEYTPTDGVLEYRLQTYTNDLILAPTQFEEWNDLSNQFRRDMRTNVVLTKIE